MSLCPSGIPNWLLVAMFKVVSFKTSGLCSHNKHYRLYLELLGVQVRYLQETHFSHTLVPKLPTHLFRSWFLTSLLVAKSRVPAIAINKNCPFSTEKHYVDPQGRYIFIMVPLLTRNTHLPLYTPQMLTNSIL